MYGWAINPDNLKRMVFGRDPRNHPDTPGFNAWLERKSERYWNQEIPVGVLGCLAGVALMAAGLIVFDGFTGQVSRALDL